MKERLLRILSLIASVLIAAIEISITVFIFAVIVRWVWNITVPSLFWFPEITMRQSIIACALFVVLGWATK